ncbi:MarR family winged helix-turn-helix transcriptional regulator [Streptomyces sp. NPDC090106]|uniref:MarR family winged helix-turn-helix transcriptional regulator n=1 Tax=Streptomyces sp. NPDC090106 TaxID=3365946 RepID=UPI00381C1326
MADRAQYEELMSRLSAVGAVRRQLDRSLPDGCSSGTALVLALLDRDGDLRIGRLSELLAVDMSVTSRHVAHLAARGWIDRTPDPADRRSRILRLTSEGRTGLAELADRSARLLALRLNDWSDDDVRLLTGLLSRLRASFDDLCPERDTGAKPLADTDAEPLADADPPPDIPASPLPDIPAGRPADTSTLPRTPAVTT